MADISKIKTPNNTTYNIKDLYRGCEFIYGTQSGTTGTWTGVSADSELVDGKQILYYLPYAGSGNATLNLTLADGSTTGAKNVYFQSTTRMTTHYGQYSQFRMIYHKSHNINGTNYEGWWSEPGRDTTTTNATQIQLNSNALKAGSSALVAGNIIVAGSDGLYKHLKAGTAFDITWPIVYLAKAVAASAATNDVYSEINFTVTTTQSITLTAQKPVYIKGTLSGTTFTPVSTAPLTQTVPSSADGYHYILLGYAYSTTAIRLFAAHPVHAYINRSFGLFSVNAGNASTVNGLTVEKAVPSNAVFTDTNTKVTSSANHYTPATASGQDKTASASGGTAAWSIDVVQGVTLNTDGKGHVTGISVTSGKIPANPNTDTKVRQTLKDNTDNTNRPLLLAYDNSSSTTTNRDNVCYRSNSIYANPSTGNLQVTQLNGVTVGSSPKFTDTTYTSKAESSGGTDVSLVTTGEKYNWNHKTGDNLNYTTSEQDTGLTWIGGQKIYQRTFELTWPGGSGIKTLYTGLGNIQVIYMEGILGGNGGLSYPLNWGYGNATTSVQIEGGNINVRVANDSWSSTTKLYITLKYYYYS